jgi:hypothetical protein
MQSGQAIWQLLRKTPFLPSDALQTFLIDSVCFIRFICLIIGHHWGVAAVLALQKLALAVVNILA